MASRRTALAFALVCALGLPARADPAAPPIGRPDAGVSAYRSYAKTQAQLLARMLRVFATDIRDGNLEAAQNDYAMTRKYLERIRPLLAAQPELAASMDAAVADHPAGESDPGFSGFHRIELGLFARRSTQGLAAYADRLSGDAARLQEAVATQPMRAEMLVDAPAALVEAVAARATGGGREPYAQTDLWDIEANVEGAKAIVAALRAQIDARDPLIMARVSAAFDATDARLAQMREGCGFKAFDQLTAAERTGLRETTVALARELARLKAVPAID